MSQIRELLRSLFRLPHATPVDLVIGELRGCLSGPLAYRDARRRVREESRRAISSAPLESTSAG
jgi:hypothetical protein